MALFLENEGFGGTPDVPSAPNAGHPQDSDLCALSKVLVIVGILAIVLGCVSEVPHDALTHKEAQFRASSYCVYRIKSLILHVRFLMCRTFFLRHS